MLGHRWQAGTGFYISTAPRQPELGIYKMTHTEERALMDAYARADYANYWHF